MNTEAFALLFLGWIVLPLWIAAGFLDWLCHRRSRIELTSGPKESVIHLLLMAEAGTAVLLGVFMEINGLVLLLMLVALAAHELTNYWDLHWAVPRREVGPFEQKVHDYLALLPLVALTLVMVLHWPQALALLGLGPDPLRLTLQWKHVPVPTYYVVSLLAAMTVFNAMPYLEEVWRGLRQRRVL
jgi:hypothetical protein